eukprot:TRINITY_DN847_c0_g1_i3.p1 TRINITY_DN847_c0_g1~~TRINITY_DN847_c0_g1_i3.p1  ORF type:complete len:241 (-),score=70.58 TRINITY_DN847_c0_g1_i3:84-806(-)
MNSTFCIPAQLAVVLCLLLGGGSVNGQKDELDGLRQTIPGEPKVDYPIYSIDILKKLNPAQFGLAPRSKAKKARKGKKSPPSSGARDNNDFDSQISSGTIPGTPQKDYPINSRSALLKKNPNKYSGIQNAPSFLIPKNYPKSKLPPRPTNLPSSLPRSKSPNAGSDEVPPARPLAIGIVNSKSVNRSPSNSDLDEHSESALNFNYCRGGSLDECINFCPGASQSVYASCVEACGRFCGGQ